MKRIVIIFIAVIMMTGCKSTQIEKTNKELEFSVNELQKTIGIKDNELINLNGSINEFQNTIDSLNKEIETYKLKNIEEKTNYVKKIEELNANIDNLNQILNSEKSLEYLVMDDLMQRRYEINENIKYYPHELSEYSYKLNDVIELLARAKDSDNQIWCFVQTRISPFQYGWVKEEKLKPLKDDYNFYNSDESIADIYLGDTKEKVRKILGEPIKIDMESSLTGTTYSYVYNDITVSFEIYNDTVAEIYTKSSNYISNIGLRVGLDAIEGYNILAKLPKEGLVSNEFYLSNNNYIYIEWGKKRWVRPDVNDKITMIRLYCGPVVP